MMVYLHSRNYYSMTLSILVVFLAQTSFAFHCLLFAVVALVVWSFLLSFLFSSLYWHDAYKIEMRVCLCNVERRYY